MACGQARHLPSMMTQNNDKKHVSTVVETMILPPVLMWKVKTSLRVNASRSTNTHVRTSQMIIKTLAAMTTRAPGTVAMLP